MRHIPLRCMLACALVAVTCVSFGLASNMIFSVFARILWMDYSQGVEAHLQRTLGAAMKGVTYDPMKIAEAMRRPIELETELPDNLKDLAAEVSANRFHVLFFDAGCTLKASCPPTVPSELVAPSSIFELVNLRCRENRFFSPRGHRRDHNPSFGQVPPRPGFLQRLLFGPVGILYFSHDFNRNYFVQSAMRFFHLHPRHHHMPPRHFDAELNVANKISAAGIDVFCPPGMERVTYEVPQNLHVMVAPLFYHGKLAGYVQVISSWALPKQMISDFSLQIMAIGLVVAVFVVVLSYYLSGWMLRPLKVVAQTARSVSEGDMSARTGLPKGRNEFYMVGNTFDGMVDNLQEAFVEQRRFIGDASHELKTPITSLLGVAEVLGIIRKDLGDNPQMDKSLATMNRELERMTELVRDLLLLSRSTEMSAQLSTDPISVTELIDDACQASLCGVLDRQVEKVAGRDLWLLGDISLLSRALRNVIDNALRYTPADKKVSVSFEKVDQEVCVEVVDEGCGIKEEYLKDLGKRFYRTDSGRARVQGGTGLGLAITRTVVERHKGRLEITSKEGVGTRVKIFLPLPDPKLLADEGD